MEEKVGKNNHRAPTALEPRSAELQFSTTLARTPFFLAALSPREFRRTTEAWFFLFKIERMNELTNERMNERTNERMNERANEWSGEFNSNNKPHHHIEL